MIISGIQTGNTRWLAAHLQNAADNETIELAEVSGTVARDIDGALAEFDAITAGTRAKEGVYAAFINPPRPLTRAQFMEALDIIAGRLGLTGQPRIVLFHIKKGRLHCHVVWSRIDAETMKAIHLSHDRQTLRKCAQEIGAKFGLELPAGLREDRGAARFDDPPQITKAEKAQQAASGLSRDQRRAVITAAWNNSDTAEAFIQALEEAGFMLARGDSRAFVVVDIAGDVHSLARQIDGAKTKDVKARLAGIDLASLPTVEAAKRLMAQRQLAQQEVISEAAIAKRETEAESAWRALQTLQRRRQLHIHLFWQKMQVRQWHERKVLEAHFLAEKERHLKRIFWNAWGLAQYIKKVAVIRQLLEHYERKKKQTLEQQHEQIRAALKRRHENEQAEIQRIFDAMLRLQRREAFTFNQQHPGTGASKAAFAAYSPKYEHLVRNGPRYFTQGSAFFNLKDPLSYDVAEDLKSTRVKATSGQATQTAEVRCEDAIRTVPKFWNTIPKYLQNALDITAPRQSAAPPKSRPDITSTFTVNAPLAGNFTVVSPLKANGKADVAATRGQGVWNPATLYPANKLDITGNKSAFGGTSGSFTFTASPDVTRVTWQQSTPLPDQPKPMTPPPDAPRT
jgi:hypothetical protein